MIKRVHVLLIIATGYLTLQGMSKTEFEELKGNVNTSFCSKFGIETLVALEQKKKGIEKTAFRTKEEYSKEIEKVNEGIIEVEGAVVLSYNLDELERLKGYKIKKKNKGIKALFKREEKSVYVSLAIWNAGLTKLKATNDINYSILNGSSLEFHSTYDAAKYFLTLVNARKELHEKLGFELFHKGSSSALVRTESSDLTS